MVKEVDGVKYRTSVLKIIEKQSDLFCKVYCAYAKANGQKVNFAFLDATDKPDPKKHFELYLAPKSKIKISAISSSLRQKADGLATLDAWKDSGWKKLFAEAREEKEKDIEKAMTNKFFASAEFAKVHERYAKKKKEKQEEADGRRKGVRFVGNPDEILANAGPRDGVRLTRGK